MAWHKNVIWDWNCCIRPVEDTNKPVSYHCHVYPLFRFALRTDKSVGCSYYLGLTVAYWFCFMLCLNQLFLFYTILRLYFIYWVSFRSEFHHVRLMSTISYVTHMLFMLSGRFCHNHESPIILSHLLCYRKSRDFWQMFCMKWCCLTGWPVPIQYHRKCYGQQILTECLTGLHTKRWAR